MRPPEKNTIVISPIGDIPDSLFGQVRGEIERIFGYATEFVPLLTDIAFAHDQNRDQYHSTRILDKLAQACPDHALKVLAITREDLFIPILTHVYGEAQLGGTASVVSTCRLDESPQATVHEKILTERIIKEIVHELGHTFKLLHCKDKTCIMHYCRSIKDVDRKANELCRYCRILLDDEKKRLAKGPA